MRLRLTVFLLLVLTAWLFSASAFSGGPPADTVKNNDGCTCHGASNSATVIHELKGWPSTYVPTQQYIMEVSSTNDIQRKPQLEENQGGFLAWVSKGDLIPTPGSAGSHGIDPGQMSSGEKWVRHNIQGEEENGMQIWNITWTGPPAGSGQVTIHVYVNRVNSNNQNSGDHWNKRTFTSSEGSGTPTSVFPTPSATTTTPADTTSSLPSPTDTPADQPGVGFVAAAAVFAAAAFVVRRRLT